MFAILLANKPSSGLPYLLALIFMTVVPFLVIDFFIIPGALMICNIIWGSTAVPLLYLLYESKLESFMNISMASLKNQISCLLLGYLFFPFAIMTFQVIGRGESDFGMLQLVLAVGAIVYLSFSESLVKAIFVSEFMKKNKSLLRIDDIYGELRRGFLAAIE